MCQSRNGEKKPCVRCTACKAITKKREDERKESWLVKKANISSH